MVTSAAAPDWGVFEEPGCLIPELSMGGMKVTTTSGELLANVDREFGGWIDCVNGRLAVPEDSQGVSTR